MKEYNKFIKEVLKDKDFEIIKNGRKPTIKLVYKPTLVKKKVNMVETINLL